MGPLPYFRGLSLDRAPPPRHPLACQSSLEPPFVLPAFLILWCEARVVLTSKALVAWDMAT